MKERERRSDALKRGRGGALCLPYRASLSPPLIDLLEGPRPSTLSWTSLSRQQQCGVHVKYLVRHVWSPPTFPSCTSTPNQHLGNL